MTKRIAFAAAMILALTASADAGTMKLKDLLAQGFSIVGTTVAPTIVTSNALATANQPDELVVTLQRAGDIAFCHFYFSATYSNETIPDADCFQPGYVAPVPVAAPSSQEPAPAPPSQMAPASVPAESSASSAPSN